MTTIVRDLVKMADNIANTLHADLKAGTIETINIELIADRCRCVLGGHCTPTDLELLINWSTRRVVEKAA